MKGKSIEKKSLQLPAAQGVRLVALLQARDARRAARALRDRHTPDGLHRFRVALRRLRSWLRAFRGELEPQVKGRDRRRLRNVARTTGRGRDADVQLARLNDAASSWRPRRRKAAVWLRDALVERQRQQGELRYDEALDEFEAIAERLEARLATYPARVEPSKRREPRLSDAVAGSLGPHLDALADALAAVQSVDDESAAHNARIAAKRLRYLLEPVAPFVRRGDKLLAKLKTLQDDLGELHDAHVLGHQIQAALRTTGAHRGRGRGARSRGSRGAGPASPPTPRDAVQAIAGDVHREAERAYRRVRKGWTGEAFARFARDLQGVARRLAKLR